MNSHSKQKYLPSHLIIKIIVILVIQYWYAIHRFPQPLLISAVAIMSLWVVPAAAYTSGAATLRFSCSTPASVADTLTAGDRGCRAVERTPAAVDALRSASMAEWRGRPTECFPAVMGADRASIGALKPWWVRIAAPDMSIQKEELAVDWWRCERSRDAPFLDDAWTRSQLLEGAPVGIITFFQVTFNIK